MLHISIAAETVFHLLSFPVTNSLLMTWVVMLFLFGVAFIVKQNLSQIPSTLQLIAELVVGGLHDFFKGIVGEAHIAKIFPLVCSFFIFILFSNWSGLLPGVGTVGVYHQAEVKEAPTAVAHAASAEVAPVATKKAELEFTPLLRAPTADLNLTIALALIAVVFIQYYGFKTLGLSYGKKFINISNPVMFFVGILEIVSEVSRIISFAFRLFGNVFAGEVLLAVMAFILKWLLPVPFIGLEIFVGLIQALVFALLTAVFLNVAVSHEESHAH